MVAWLKRSLEVSFRSAHLDRVSSQTPRKPGLYLLNVSEEVVGRRLESRLPWRRSNSAASSSDRWHAHTPGREDCLDARH